MTEAPTFSMSSGRARSSFAVDAQIDHMANCHVDRWLGGHGVSAIDATVTGATFAGAKGYSPTTTVKRLTPGNLAGGLT
ncbi:MAG: hypothetical protein ABWZ99_15910 [Ilumatobacteraceae bacterium]